MGSPVFFSSVSEDTLEDIGKEGKTIDQEIVRQLRQNNLGPTEMLLPLTSLNKRKDFGEAIESKKNSHPELAISGGGSIFDMLTFKDYFGGLDQYNLKGRFEAFFVYNRATTRGDLWDRLSQNSSNDNVQALLKGIPKDGRPGNFWARVLSDPRIASFSGVKIANLVGFPFFLIEELFYQWVQNSLESLTKMQLRLRFATFVLKMQEITYSNSQKKLNFLRLLESLPMPLLKKSRVMHRSHLLILKV